MADPKPFNDEAAALARVDAVIRRAKALKEAAGGEAILVHKTVSEGTEISAQKAERGAAREVAAFDKVEKKARAATRATIEATQTFIDQKANVVSILNAVSREDKAETRQSYYKRKGLSPDFISEAESLRELRKRQQLLLRISRGTQSGQGSDANDAFAEYQRIADPKYRFSPNISASELDFQAYNQFLSVSRQVGQRQDRLTYRYARDQGLLQDKSSLTDKEASSRITQLARTPLGQTGIPNVHALVSSMYTAHIGDVPAYVRAQEKAGLLPISARISTLTPAQQVENMLAQYEQSAVTAALRAQPEIPIALDKESTLYQRLVAKARAALKNRRGSIDLFPEGRGLFGRATPGSEVPKFYSVTPELDEAKRYIDSQRQVLRSTGGRGFEVTGALPPVRTTPYPPTLLEMQQGITPGSVARAREAAGLAASGRPRDARGRFIARSGGPPPIIPPVTDTELADFGGGKGGRGGAFGGGIAGRFSSLLKYSIAASVIYPIFTAISSSITKATELEVIMKRIEGIYGGRTLGDQLAVKAAVVDVARTLSSDLVETARTAQLLAQEQIPIGKLAENLKAIAQGSVGLGISQEGLANFVIAVRNLTSADARPFEGPELINLISAFVSRGAVSPQNLMTAIQQIMPALVTFAPNESAINDPALIAGITSVTARRSSFTGSQVANTLKYLISRFGEPGIVEDIQDRIGVGAGTAASGGQELKPFIEQLKDISEGYSKLIATGQTAAAQNLVRLLFGPRQAGVGIALLENFTIAVQETKTAIEDITAAEALAEKQQITWNKSLERLSTNATVLFGSFLEGAKLIGGPVLELFSTFFKELDTGFEQVAVDIGKFLIWLEKIQPAAEQGARAAANALSYGRIGTATPPPPPPPSSGKGYLPSLIAQSLFGYRGTRPATGPQSIPATGPQSITDLIPTTPDAPLYSDKEFQEFYRAHQRRVQLLEGQQQGAADFGALFASPKRNLQQLTTELERFYQVIHIGEREVDESLFGFIDRVTGKTDKLPGDTFTANRMKQTFLQLRRDLEPALLLEQRRLEGISGYTQGSRIEDATARALDQTNRVRRRLARTFGRRGLEEFPIQTMRNELEKIATARLFDIERENAAYATRKHLLEGEDTFGVLNLDYWAKRKPLRDAELTALDQEHKANLAILDVNSQQLAIQTEINAIYESRLKDLQEIESLSQDINNIIKSAFAGLPGSVRSRGVLGNFLGSILGPVSTTLFKNVTDNINLTGKGGLFPKIGETLNQLTGPPSLTYDLGDTINAAGQIVHNVGQKTPEQLRKEQIAAQIRALEIAIGATLGSAAGKGGPAAQAGSQLGAIGGAALLGGRLGAFGGPLGALAGGLIGGLLGGLFDKPKKTPPELVALEIISRNTGEQVTLLENTNRLLELQNLAFNVPTGFTLPKFGPANFGGQGFGSAGVSNEINVEVNIGGSSSSAQDIGTVVAQAVSERLQSEYSSGGRYVGRTRY